MTQKHREFGLSPNLHTRPATVPCEPCAACGTTAAVERGAVLLCVYCLAPVVASDGQEP